MHPRVLERIAAKAAVDIPDVRATPEDGLTGLVGRQRPSATVHVGGRRVRARVVVDVRWPKPVAEVAAAVRVNVAEQVRRLTGLEVAAVDVHVSGPTAPSADAGRRVG
jgi:uncharacterized alkaline shock family protein YloU